MRHWRRPWRLLPRRGERLRTGARPRRRRRGRTGRRRSWQAECRLNSMCRRGARSAGVTRRAKDAGRGARGHEYLSQGRGSGDRSSTMAGRGRVGSPDRHVVEPPAGGLGERQAPLCGHNLRGPEAPDRAVRLGLPLLPSIRRHSLPPCPSVGHALPPRPVSPGPVGRAHRHPRRRFRRLGGPRHRALSTGCGRQGDVQPGRHPRQHPRR
jgi:hypothetical protein